MTRKAGLLLYGANGYTGKLLADVARRDGVPVTLAGRRREAIEPLATALGLPWLAFPLDGDLAGRVAPFRALLLAAGPFSATSRPAVDACLAAGTSYLDITGEIEVFEAVFARHAEAVRAGVTLLPGCGFDVVPSDCLANALAEALPGAESLELAFRGFKTSGGTARTMVEGLAGGGRVRRGGRIEVVPPAWKTMQVPFPDRTRLAMTIPWGDVSTAFRSTGIPGIEVYMAASPALVAAARRSGLFAPLLRLGPVQSLLKWQAGKLEGPSAQERVRETSVLWGRVTKGDRSIEGTLETLEGYTLTAETGIAIARRVLHGGVPPGALTPAQAFGARFIESIRGSRLRVPRAGS